MSLVLNLPAADGTLSAYRLSGEPTARPDAPPSFSRIAYAAAHVVSDPLRDSFLDNRAAARQKPRYRESRP